MEKVRYMISDAANIVNVESHVLRYWEDELALSIPRNEMGHRYYTKENIQEFQRIKELKEQGYQLKAIRMIVHNGPLEGLTAESAEKQVQQAPLQQGSTLSQAQQPLAQLSTQQTQLQADLLAQTPVQEVSQSILDNTDKMAQFTDLMSQIVGKAIQENNQALSQNISEEGCLSVPDKSGVVVRPDYVKVKALDRDGNEVFYEGEDLLARAFCHEIDHLNGVCFVDLAKDITIEKGEE